MSAKKQGSQWIEDAGKLLFLDWNSARRRFPFRKHQHLRDGATVEGHVELRALAAIHIVQSVCRWLRSQVGELA